MKYKHIIWDYNGTLLNDAYLCVEVMNEMLQSRNLELVTIKKYRDIFDFPVKNYYEKIGFDFEKESFETVGNDFIVNYGKRVHEAKIQMYAEDILRNINASRVPQSILSARMQLHLMRELQNSSIKKYFTNIIGLEDQYAEGKVEKGRKLIKKINLPRKNILLIGDTTHDFEVAKETGIDSVLVSNGHHSFRRLEKCDVPVFENLYDVWRYLKVGQI